MSLTDAGREIARTEFAQKASTTDGNGTVCTTDGYTRNYIEVNETVGGTCTLTFQGSYDGATWFALDYSQVDSTVALTYVHAALSVTASMKHVYVIRDLWPKFRAVQSSSAGGVSVTVRVYETP